MNLDQSDNGPRMVDLPQDVDIDLFTTNDSIYCKAKIMLYPFNGPSFNELLYHMHMRICDIKNMRMSEAALMCVLREGMRGVMKNGTIDAPYAVEVRFAGRKLREVLDPWRGDRDSIMLNRNYDTGNFLFWDRSLVHDILNYLQHEQPIDEKETVLEVLRRFLLPKQFAPCSRITLPFRIADDVLLGLRRFNANRFRVHDTPDVQPFITSLTRKLDDAKIDSVLDPQPITQEQLERALTDGAAALMLPGHHRAAFVRTLRNLNEANGIIRTDGDTTTWRTYATYQDGTTVDLTTTDDADDADDDESQ